MRYTMTVTVEADDERDALELILLEMLATRPEVDHADYEADCGS